MALLTPSEPTERTQLRISINSMTADKIKTYCEFADIKKVDEFMEKAAEYVLSKDKGWQAHQSRQPV